MTDAYVDLDFVKAVGSMPAADIDILETAFPGTFDAIAGTVTRMFDAKLTKRYSTPFGLDSLGAFDIDRVPDVIKLNVCDVVIYYLWRKRGFNPGSAQDEDAIIGARDRAITWLQEAADSQNGLIELPLRDTGVDQNAVVKAAPLSYTETSPFVWADRQREIGSGEDSNGRGS